MACFLISSNDAEKAVPHYFCSLANELARRGHRVFLLVTNPKGTSQAQAKNVTVLPWPSTRATQVKDARFLYALIRQQRPACIISNFGAENWCLLLGKLTGVPWRITWYHTLSQQIDLDTRLPAWRRKLQRWRKSWIYRLTTHIVANSQAAAADVQQVYAVPAEKCAVLPLLIADPHHSAMARELTKIVCVGRLHLSKGQATLLQAVALMRRVCPQLEVEFIGDGPEKARYEALAARLGVHDCCRFSGTLPWPEVLKRMAAAAVCVSPSAREAFGLVNVEAQAVGTPLVASKVDGIKEIVLDGETGYLVPPDDAAAFAEKILDLLENNELREKFSARARQHFAVTFSLQNLTRHADYFEQLVLGKRPAWPDTAQTLNGSNSLDLKTN